MRTNTGQVLQLFGRGRIDVDLPDCWFELSPEHTLIRLRALFPERGQQRRQQVAVMAMLDEQHRLAIGAHRCPKMLLDVIKIIETQLVQFLIVEMSNEKLADGAERNSHGKRPQPTRSRTNW